MALSELLCHIQAGPIENKSIPGPQQTSPRRTGFGSRRSILFFVPNAIFFNNMISADTAGPAGIQNPSVSFKAFPGRNPVVEFKAAAEF